MKKKNKHKLDQKKKKGKTSRNDLLIRPVLHNTAPTTCKATLPYKLLFYKELREQNEHKNQLRSREGLHPPRGACSYPNTA